jgi:hypothetical protein
MIGSILRKKYKRQLKVFLLSYFIAKFGKIFIWMIATSSTSNIWSKRKRRKVKEGEREKNKRLM